MSGFFFNLSGSTLNANPDCTILYLKYFSFAFRVSPCEDCGSLSNAPSFFGALSPIVTLNTNINLNQLFMSIAHLQISGCSFGSSKETHTCSGSFRWLARTNQPSPHTLIYIHIHAYTYTNTYTIIYIE